MNPDHQKNITTKEDDMSVPSRFKETDGKNETEIQSSYFYYYCLCDTQNSKSCTLLCAKKILVKDTSKRDNISTFSDLTAQSTIDVSISNSYVNILRHTNREKNTLYSPR